MSRVASALESREVVDFWRIKFLIGPRWGNKRRRRIKTKEGDICGVHDRSETLLKSEWGTYCGILDRSGTYSFYSLVGSLLTIATTRSSSCALILWIAQTKKHALE